MVFFTKAMTRTITMMPASLGAGLRELVRQRLVAEVEGMAVEGEGFLITVLEISDEGLEHGLIDHFTGAVRYTVKYSALMMRLFNSEILDAVVASVSEVRRLRVTVRASPPVSRAAPAPPKHTHSHPPAAVQLGCFVDVGPQRILVSHMYMPSDYEYVADDNSFTSMESSIKIKVGSALRVKIVHANDPSSVASLAAIASIADPFLGLL